MALSWKQAQNKFQAVGMILSVESVAQYAKDMHAVCGWLVDQMFMRQI